LILLVLDIRPATCNEEYHQKHGRLNIAKLSGVIDFDSATGVVRAAWSIQLNISFLMFSPLFSFAACHLITLYNYIQDQWDEWFNHQPTKYRNKSCNTIASIKLEPSTPLNSGAGLCQLSFRKSGAFSRASDNYLQVIYAIYGCFLGASGWLTLPKKKHQVGAKTDFKLLTRFLLPEGFIPPVVPEVDSVTVGGAIAGLVMESSSFRYGFLHNAVVAMEAMR
jgi:hypothetical protein